MDIETQPYELMEMDVEELVQKARQGHSQALEQIVIAIQDKVYAMALRMVGHPEDARDETQEILTKVITNLGGFRNESRFLTWVYRISANHLINACKSRAERLKFSFEQFEESIMSEEPPSVQNYPMDAEERLLEEEMKHTCVLGILLCLSRDLRLAFILGQVFEVSSKEGAFILNISPAAFRKRLSRGRELIQNFMLKSCGRVSPRNRCKCRSYVTIDIKAGYINSKRLRFAGKMPNALPDDDTLLEGLDEIGRIAAIFANYPRHPTPTTFVSKVRSLIQAGR